MSLTDTKIRHAKPAEKPFKLSDGRSLHLLVTQAGGKLWRFQYRFDGKQKTLALGAYPDVGLKQARDRLDEARRLLANGIDPSETRKAQKATANGQAANAFEVVAREWFARFSSNKAASHSRRVIRLLERDVFPYLGSLAIAKIDAPALLTVLQRIEQRGALDPARRARQICGQVFRYGIATGRATSDIAQGLEGALMPVVGGHFAATTDLPRLAQILKGFDAYRGSLVVASALRLMPLVFVRPGELRHAKWVEIDLESAEWRYVVSKTKTPHIVPLARQALAILRNLQPLTGSGKFVFPSARTATRPMSDNAILAAMRGMGIVKEEMTGHGFRAVARTLLDETLEVRPDFIEHQLAHAVRDPNGRAYNRTAHLSGRREMMQLWADYLDKLKIEH